MHTNKQNSFTKIGKLITKRKYIVLITWMLILALVVPFILDLGSVISLQMDTASDKNLESQKASDLISAQFSSTVANDTLMIVISSKNASSVQTQDFINRIVTEIKTDPRITNLENVTSIYTILIPAINQTNQATYTIYDNANLTYTLLYGVPTAYLTIWETAYNQTQETLASGLSQTNQALYTAIENANMTYNLLYSVPATYMNIWSQTFSQTQNIPMSNEIAYNQTAAMLYQADPAAFSQYTSHLLDAFNTSWALSFQNLATQSTPIERASSVSTQVNQLYINSFLGSNETAKAFATALINEFSLQDFLTNTQAQNNAKLQNFAVQYISNSSGSSTEFVNATYNLGKNPSTAALDSIVEDIIWNPEAYDMGQNFIHMFNEIAYNQSAIYLKDADQESFEQYTSHLLDLFNISWSQSFTDPATLNSTPKQRATVAIGKASTQYVNTYLGDNKDFGIAIIQTFSLQDFLANDTEQISQKLQSFALEYIANQSGLSSTFVNAACELGRNCDYTAIQNLAGNIISNPASYNLGQQLISGINSLVSPSKNLTLISIGLADSNGETLGTIRDIIKSELAEDSSDIISALVTGRSALDSDFGKSATKDLDFILPVTIVLLIVATGLYFRSIVTPIVTLGTIGVGLGISQIFVVLIGTYINQVDFMIPTVLLTVLLGVGTDYSIFILARHREELINGLSIKDAIEKSVIWAGESIVTSGTTVIISFLGLAITTMILLQTLGIIVGLSIIVALLVSLTLVPALAVILGGKLFWPTSGARFQRYANTSRRAANKKTGYFARSGAFSVKHAKIIIIIALLITAPMLYVCVNNTPTYNFIGGASKDLESINAMDLLSSSFGGSLFPTYIVVTFSDPLVDSSGVLNTAELSQVQAISEHLLTFDGVKEVTSATMPYGSPIAYSNLAVSNSANSAYSAVLENIGADNKTALITLDFQIDPYSNQALNIAQDIRTCLHNNYDGTNNITSIYVGGTTGSMIDVKQVFDNQFITILPIVTIGVGIVLFIVLGSLILPLFAILSVLMSIVWTLGATVLVFQTGFNYGLLFITPMILLVLLLGIGMDYNIFILTRIREESAKDQKLNSAIIHAIEQTGGIITAAAIILAGSLGALMLSSNLLLKEMGFAFAFSILIDALVVRTYLVPAVMSALGKWNWYNPLPFFKRSKALCEKKD